MEHPNKSSSGCHVSHGCIARKRALVIAAGRVKARVEAAVDLCNHMFGNRIQRVREEPKARKLTLHLVLCDYDTAGLYRCHVIRQFRVGLKWGAARTRTLPSKIKIPWLKSSITHYR